MLATQAEPLAPIGERWSGEKSSRRRYVALCEIPCDIPAEDLERRVAAFGGGYFGVTPAITLHGHRFQLVPGAPAADQKPVLSEREALVGISAAAPFGP